MNNSWIERKKTKPIFVGSVGIGGDHPISIQSMTNTNTADIKATVNQIEELEAAGADIVRVSVPDEDCAKAFKKIKNSGSICLGKYAVMAMTDYNVGSNHILPTSGSAKYSSGISVNGALKSHLS